MSSSRREKIALALFAFLVALGALGAFAYIVIGHSWNFTATKVDDLFGRMEDYAVVCFDGVVAPASDNETVDPADADKFATTSIKDNAPKTQPGFDAVAVAKQYSSLGASSFVIGSDDLFLYRDGAIKTHGDWRVGILSVEKRVSSKVLLTKLKNLQGQNPHLVVLVTTSDDYLAGVTSIPYVDVLIDLDGRSSGLSNLNGIAARVVSPEQGSVGVVLVSASKVVSSKVIHNISEAVEAEEENS